ARSSRSPVVSVRETLTEMAEANRPRRAGRLGGDLTMSESHLATDLLGRVQRGEGEAFGALVRLLEPVLLGLLRKRLGWSVADGQADDVLQETWLRVWSRRGRFDPALGAAAAWVWTIARNCALDAGRRRAARPARALDEEVLDPAPGPETEVAAQEIAARLARTLRRGGGRGRPARGLRPVNGTTYAPLAPGKGGACWAVAEGGNTRR